jgi:O-antigen/teichoic acid export membrane protein
MTLADPITPLLSRVANAESTRLAAIAAMRLTTMAVKFVLTIYIARRMGLADLGLYGLVSSVVIVGPIVASMGLMGLLARELVTRTLDELTQLLVHYWRVVGAVYAAVFLPVALGIGLTFGQPALCLITLGIWLFEHANNDGFAVLISRHRPLLANSLYFLRAGAWMLAFMAAALVAPLSWAVTLLLSTWFVFELIAFIGFAIAVRDWPWSSASAPLRETVRWWRETVVPALKFWASDTGSLLGLYVDRYIITAMLGLEYLGVYVLFWSVANAVYNLTETGTLQTRRPRLIDAYHRGDTTGYRLVFRSMSANSLGSIVALSLAAGALFPLALQFVNRPLADSFVPLLWILLLAGVARVGFGLLTNDLYARRRDIAMVTTSILLLPVSAILSLVLLPVWGLYGAAWAGVIALALLTASRIVVVMREA